MPILQPQLFAKPTQFSCSRFVLRSAEALLPKKVVKQSLAEIRYSFHATSPLSVYLFSVTERKVVNQTGKRGTHTFSKVGEGISCRRSLSSCEQLLSFPIAYMRGLSPPRNHFSVYRRKKNLVKFTSLSFHTRTLGTTGTWRPRVDFAIFPSCFLADFFLLS